MVITFLPLCPSLTLSTLWANSADNKLISETKYFFLFLFFLQKTGFDTSCKLSPKETICIKCQSLYFRKNKKNIFSLSSAELAQRVVKNKAPVATAAEDVLNFSFIFHR